MSEEPERLGDVLDRAVMPPARRKRSMIERAKRKWIEVAGKEAAMRSWPRNVRRGVLTVEVESSALLAELAGYRQAEILRGLTAGKDALGVRKIKFVLAEGQT